MPALIVMFSWYFGPFLAEDNQTPLAPTVFDLRGIAVAATVWLVRRRAA